MSDSAKTELKLDDTWMESHYNDQSVVVNVIERTPIEAFVPACRTLPATQNSRFHTQSFCIDCERDGRGGLDTDAISAWINKGLVNHQEGQQVRSRYLCGEHHNQSIRFIYPYQTTARGISIFC